MMHYVENPFKNTSNPFIIELACNVNLSFCKTYLEPSLDNFDTLCIIVTKTSVYFVPAKNTFGVLQIELVFLYHPKYFFPKGDAGVECASQVCVLVTRTDQSIIFQAF